MTEMVSTTVIGQSSKLPTVGADPDCIARLRAEASDAVVLFETAATTFGAEDRALIVDLARKIASCPQAVMSIEGHSDRIGDGSSNMQLSWDRAEAIYSVIAEAGIDTRQFRVMGFGDRNLKMAGDLTTGHAENRRVELVLR